MTSAIKGGVEAESRRFALTLSSFPEAGVEIRMAGADSDLKYQKHAAGYVFLV